MFTCGIKWQIREKKKISTKSEKLDFQDFDLGSKFSKVCTQAFISVMQQQECLLRPEIQYGSFRRNIKLLSF